MSDRHPNARAALGHTEAIMLKLHPELKRWVDARAAERYCSQAEYVRQLIVADRLVNGGVK